MQGDGSGGVEKKQGLLLVNLGTPDSPDPRSIRRYLREFLSDPRVIDINPIARWVILNLFILPFRPRKAAAAYREIWTEAGSPLMVHTKALVEKLRKVVPESVDVDFAMRYQNPSIQFALERFRKAGIDDITVLPLFPQYASAAGGSVVERAMTLAGKAWNAPNLAFIGEFYDHPAFIESFRSVGQRELDSFDADAVLFSFHGLPERHCTKSEESEVETCFATTACCNSIHKGNRRCYRAQCFATARFLAAALKLESSSWHVAFQSRLGRSAWIQPYLEPKLHELAAAGAKRLAVFSPAFVADCLETLEEIRIRARQTFIEAGGEDLRLVTSLNSEDVWVRGVLDILRERSALGVPLS